MFFDLDGTLIDSIELILRCFEHATLAHTGRSLPRSEILTLIGKPLRPELERLAPGQGQLITDTYREMQYKLHDELVKPFDGIAHLISDLSAASIHVGIVTSKARGGTQKALELFGETARLFSTIITVDDSEKHKPDPEPLWLACERAHCLPGDAVYVGDTRFDMEAAIAAGCLPIGVTWGVATAEQLKVYTPHVFAKVGELRTFLLNGSSQ